jgi:hypothetical protein
LNKFATKGYQKKIAFLKLAFDQSASLRISFEPTSMEKKTSFTYINFGIKGTTALNF